MKAIAIPNLRQWVIPALITLALLVVYVLSALGTVDRTAGSVIIVISLLLMGGYALTRPDEERAGGNVWLKFAGFLSALFILILVWGSGGSGYLLVGVFYLTVMFAAGYGLTHDYPLWLVIGGMLIVLLLSIVAGYALTAR